MSETRANPGGGETWGASWQEHHRRQLTLGLSATPAARLAWLEQAIEFAYEAGALPRLDSSEKNEGEQP